MRGFTELELAALRMIFAETPDQTATLNRQLDHAQVVARTNTGAGFSTTFAISEDAAPADLASPIDPDTHARIDGLERDMGFLVFLEGGKMHRLEGYTYQESTEGWDLADLKFLVFNAKVHRPP